MRCHREPRNGSAKGRFVSLLSFLSCHFEEEKRCGPHTERHLSQSRLLEHEFNCSAPDNGFVLMNCVHDGHNYEVGATVRSVGRPGTGVAAAVD